MNWITSGFSLGTWFRTKVIVSWLFLIYAGYCVYQSQDQKWTAVAMLLLFGIVLLHEFGHCIACRMVGGDAPQIVLWPLGGLAFTSPPQSPGAYFISTAGGPLVNVVLLFVFWGANAWLWAYGFNTPLLASHFQLAELGSSWLNFLAYCNAALLAFNLLPIYPLDGGRMLQEILWKVVGYPKSLEYSGILGTICGVALVGLGFGFLSISVPMIDPLTLHLTRYPIGRQGSQDGILITIGLMAAMSSYSAYTRSREIASWRKN